MEYIELEDDLGMKTVWINECVNSRNCNKNEILQYNNSNRNYECVECNLVRNISAEYLYPNCDSCNSTSC